MEAARAGGEGASEPPKKGWHFGNRKQIKNKHKKSSKYIQPTQVIEILPLLVLLDFHFFCKNRSIRK